MRLELSRRAISDLAAHHGWLAREAGLDIAERMLVGANRAFAKLVDAPGLGSSIEVRSPTFADLRKWRVEGFPNLRIFYRTEKDVLIIARVLHSAQNWSALLDSD